MKDYRLHFHIEGEGALNLFWLHGFGGNLHVWDKSTPYFSQFRNIRVDYLGHGQSDKDVSPERAVEQTLTLIEKLVAREITGPIVWIGHSFAGNLMAELINRIPSTKAAVFVDCTCLISDEHRSSRNLMARKWEESPDKALAIENFYENLMDPQVDPKISQELKAMLGECSPQFLIDFYKTFNTIPPRPEKKLPVLIFEAEHYIAKEKSRSFLQYFPEAQHELVEKADHFFFFEHPAPFNQRVERFLENLKESTDP